MNYYQATTGANVQLDDAAFWNVDHVTMVYFPVGPEDYESTTVRRHTPFLARCAGGWQESMLTRCTLDASTWTARIAKLVSVSRYMPAARPAQACLLLARTAH